MPIFNESGEIQLPRVVWFIIIGVAGGLVIKYSIILTMVILFVSPITVIILFLTGVLILVGIDNAVDKRREVRR